MDKNKKEINPFWLFVFGCAVGAAIGSLIYYIKKHEKILMSYLQDHEPEDDHHEYCGCGEADCTDDEKNDENDSFHDASSELSDIVEEINNDNTCW